MTSPSMSVSVVDRASDVTELDELAQLLRHLRRRQARQRGRAELTYREIAARTGWSIGIIAGYFGGRTLPPTDRFDVLVALLDATPAERGALATARDRVQENRRRLEVAPPSGVPDWPVPRQLPADSVRFVGRSAQVAELDALLRSDGAAPGGVVVVLSGTAGIGKTALAVHWAHRVAAHFPDGQLHVNLQGYAPDGAPLDPARVVRGFLDAFGVAAERVPVGVPAQVGLYRSLLAGRRVLVVLDNARDAEQVRPLLPGSPTCLTVVTSRDELSSLVVEGAHRLALDLLPAEEARQLLVRRLGAGRVAAEPETVAEVVRRCAGLPLALAIVAARASARPRFPLATLAGELRQARDSLDPFAAGDGTADARVAFSCSYRWLSPAAATLFRRLGAHPGPELTAPAAASLVGVAPAEVRPALAELTRAHLLDEPAPGRFASHDLLRAFAAEQAYRMDPADDRRAAARRCLDHYLHTAYAAAMLLYPYRDPITLVPASPGVTPERLADRGRARAWFEAEQVVLLAAVRQAADTGFAEHSWQLTWALGDFLDWRGQWHDLLAVHRIALRAASRLSDPTGQAHIRRGLARAYIRLGRLRPARTHLDRAIELSRLVGDNATEAASHLNLSLLLEHQGRLDEALRHSQRAYGLFRAAAHLAGQARSLNAVGWYHCLLGDHAQALACCRRALALQTRIGSRNDLASTMDTLGYAQDKLGRHREAVASYRQAVALYRETGDRYHEADTLVHLGEDHQALGERGPASDAWRRAIEILAELRHPAADGLRRRAEAAGQAVRD